MLGVGGQAQRAGGDYAVRRFSHEVLNRMLGYMSSFFIIESKTAYRTSAADALSTFLGGFHKLAGTSYGLTGFLIDSTTTA